MRAARVLDLIGPAGVAVRDCPAPADTGQVVVAVEHAGVGFVDYLQSYGRYQDTHEVPFTLGMEVAGTVASAPRGAAVAVGDRVMGFTRIGGFAERVALDPELTFALPDGVSTVDGAAMVLNYQTATFALVSRADVRSGETVLVHGAAGGVGTASIQVARALDAKVVAVVSSAAKADAARRAGAHEVHLAGDDASWLDRLRQDHPGGVDVVVDPVGGTRSNESLRALAPHGRLLAVGFASGDIAQVRLNRLLLRNISVVGAAWGELLKSEPALGQQLHERIAEWMRAGVLRPVVDRVVPLADVGPALEDIGGRRVNGKIVLAVGDTPPA